jgi:ribonuclease P protein component
MSYSKKEKLKSEKLITKLFSEGQSVLAYPLRLVYLPTNSTDKVEIKTGVSVSKRNFKSAVDRNRIKRLLREAYRLNKSDYFNNITASYAFMILYIGKEGTDFDSVNKKTKKLLEKFVEKVSEESKTSGS